MGSFLPSHMDQGLIFGLLGLWHGFNTLALYLRNPKAFRYRTWFPTQLPWTFRYLELWLILFIILAFISVQMSRALPDLAAGVVQFRHIQRFQHVAFGLFALLYVVVALISAQSSALPLPAGALHSTFALAFALELVVFHFGHHPGDTLEHFVHMLMQIILAALVSLIFLEILWPHNFLVSFGRCMLLGLKGAWFFNIGVLINMPSGMPLGCAAGTAHFPICPVGEPLMRAKAIQVLVFSLEMLVIVVGAFIAFALLNKFLIKAPYVPILKSLDDPANNYIPILKTLDDPVRKLESKDGLLKDREENVPIISMLEVAIQAGCHLQHDKVSQTLDLGTLSQNLNLGLVSQNLTSPHPPG